MQHYILISIGNSQRKLREKSINFSREFQLFDVTVSLAKSSISNKYTFDVFITY